MYVYSSQDCAQLPNGVSKSKKYVAISDEKTKFWYLKFHVSQQSHSIIQNVTLELSLGTPCFSSNYFCYIHQQSSNQLHEINKSTVRDDVCGNIA